MQAKSKFHDAKKVAEKYFRKFTNFTKHQKLFVLFLMVFALSLVFFPIATINPIATTASQVQASYSLWLFGLSGAFFKSALIILLALAFLFGWNTHISFKSFVVKFFGFRETEPVLNFIFLWVIVSVYMGMLDMVGLAREQTGSLSIARGLRAQMLILIVGLGVSIVEVRKSANQNSQKTKILNIVDDEAPKMQENKRFVQHLFDEEEFE